jgi:hypothetical protein
MAWSPLHTGAMVAGFQHQTIKIRQHRLQSMQQLELVMGIADIKILAQEDAEWISV